MYTHRFQGRFRTIDREFKSPLGFVGAYYALAIFALVYISSAFMQGDQFVSFIIIVVYSLFATGYYYAGPASTQVITDEEFRCNVINANYRRSHGDFLYRVFKFCGIPDRYLTFVQKAIKSRSRSGSRSGASRSSAAGSSNAGSKDGKNYIITGDSSGPSLTDSARSAMNFAKVRAVGSIQAIVHSVQSSTHSRSSSRVFVDKIPENNIELAKE